MTTSSNFGFSEKPTILAIDDSPDNLWLLSGLLKDQYRIKLCGSGEKGLAISRGEAPDLILLDVMMPGLSGYEVCRQLKADPATQHVPIIFLTAMTSTADEERGLALGAADFITKPINPPIVLARVATQLQAKAGADFLRDQNKFLEEEVQKRAREITAIQDVTILAMASLAETRDNETGNHIRRTQNYVRVLAQTLRERVPRLREQLSDHRIDLLFKSAPLHDIGKIGIPDRILLKPGRFEPHEFEIMKRHTTLGRDAIQHAEDMLGVPVEFLQCAKEIAYSHQEKWDGSGYPQGLSGEAIPLSARIMAVADVYDALISRRVYKDGMSHEQALGIMREGRGSHFDPDILDVFLALAEEFRRIAQRFVDSDADIAEKAQDLALAKGDGSFAD
jgi:putative two-component system response regulator